MALVALSTAPACACTPATANVMVALAAEATPPTWVCVPATVPAVVALAAFATAPAYGTASSRLMGFVRSERRDLREFHIHIRNADTTNAHDGDILDVESFVRGQHKRVVSGVVAY